MTESPRGASMAVFQDGAVLLVQRRLPPLAGLWSLPGGKLESGEAPEQAALREVREETGIVARIAGVVGHHTARFETVAGDGSYVTKSVQLEVFYGTAPSGQSPVAADDAAAAIWVSLHDLQRYDLTPGAAALIHEAAALLADNSTLRKE